MKVKNVDAQVLVGLIRARITELNESLQATDHPGHRAAIRARLTESLNWLISMGESVEVSK